MGQSERNSASKACSSCGRQRQDLVGTLRLAERLGPSCGEHEIRPQRSQVEARGAVEAELAVERPHGCGAPVRLRAHEYGAGVQVTVQQRLGAGHETVLGEADLAEHSPVAAEGVDIGLVARQHRVVLVLDVRLGEDEILGDLAQFGVDRAGEQPLLLDRVQAEHRGGEGRAGDVAADLGRRPTLHLTAVQLAAPDP